MLFLGTAGAVPTSQRAPSAYLIRRGGERILVDCGEGTQRQMLRSSAGLADIDLALITHFHADHVLGLPGMLKTFALRGREAPLQILGPRGLRALMGSLDRVIGRLTFPMQLIELEPADTVERDGYRIEPFATEHGVASLGYALCEQVRPGRFDIATATALGVPFGPLCGELQHGRPVHARRTARVVIAGAGGRARPGPAAGSCSPVTHARVRAPARRPPRPTCWCTRPPSWPRRRCARARPATAPPPRRPSSPATPRWSLLALTHLSTRHTGGQIRREARAVFEATVVPRDFDVIELPMAERGQPQLVRADGGEASTAAGAGRLMDFGPLARALRRAAPGRSRLGRAGRADAGGAGGGAAAARRRLRHRPLRGAGGRAAGRARVGCRSVARDAGGRARTRAARDRLEAGAGRAAAVPGRLVRRRARASGAAPGGQPGRRDRRAGAGAGGRRPGGHRQLRPRALRPLPPQPVLSDRSPDIDRARFPLPGDLCERLAGVGLAERAGAHRPPARIDRAGRPARARARPLHLNPAPAGRGRVRRRAGRARARHGDRTQPVETELVWSLVTARRA